jgi:hypothetical protein
MQLRFNAVVGHAIVATNTFCFRQRTGTYGPYDGSGATTSLSTFPSRLIAGLGVELVGGPRLIYANSSRHTYRISVKHGPAYIPLGQTFDFDIHYYSYGLGRICFTGRTCGPYYR